MLNIVLRSGTLVLCLAMGVALRVQKEMSLLDGWHRIPINESGHAVYGLIHTPKTAGSSFAVDAGKYIPKGDGYFSAERCPGEIMRELQSKSHQDSRFELLAFLRAPQAQVYSQYLELIYDEDFGWAGKANFAQECPNVSAFLDRFTVGPGTNHSDYAAYHPQDMQTRSLSCKGTLSASSNHFYQALSEEDFHQALDNVKTYKFIGITESYQASMCLFIDKMDPASPLPDYCDCTNQTASAAFPHHRVNHYAPKHSVKDLSVADLKKIDTLTPKDVRLYEAGVKRFNEEVRELETRRALRIHCP